MRKSCMNLTLGSDPDRLMGRWVGAWVQSKAQKRETKCFPLSETMSAGVPCLVKIFCRKIFASCGESMSDLVGMKWAILVSQSTTTNIVSKPLETGNHSIKSMDMEDQGLLGIGRKRSGP